MIVHQTILSEILAGILAKASEQTQVCRAVSPVTPGRPQSPRNCLLFLLALWNSPLRIPFGKFQRAGIFLGDGYAQSAKLFFREF